MLALNRCHLPWHGPSYRDLWCSQRALRHRVRGRWRAVVRRGDAIGRRASLYASAICALGKRDPWRQVLLGQARATWELGVALTGALLHGHDELPDGWSERSDPV